MLTIQWALPTALYLLPLVILPWISKNAEKKVVSTSLIPHDPVSDLIGLLLKALGSLVFLCLTLTLAKPYYPEQLVQRLGSGSEIILLVDRSRSMDNPFTSRKDAVAASRTVGKENSKRHIANTYLLDFVDKRPDDRFGFILFSNKALDLLSFTHNHESVKAVIKASSLGKGLSETNIAQALIKSAQMYSKEDYHGQRAVLLISDGGQALSSAQQNLIRDLFQREHITLYWLYVGDRKGLTTENEVNDVAETPDKKLHDFFKTLFTPYTGFEIESVNALAETFEAINQQQNGTILVDEILPRKYLTTPILAVAMIASLLLLLTHIYTVWGVRQANH